MHVMSSVSHDSSEIILNYLVLKKHLFLLWMLEKILLLKYFCGSFQHSLNLHLHLADAFIQSDLRLYIQAIHFLSVCLFPGNWTHNLLRC